MPSDQVDDLLLGLTELTGQLLVGKTVLLHGSIDGRADWLRFGHCEISSCVRVRVSTEMVQRDRKSVV